MTIESDLHRIANALEAIGNYLQRLAYPPFTMTPPAPDVADELERLIPTDALSRVIPRVDPPETPPGQVTPIDPAVAFISGQWKRRQGHELYDTSSSRLRGAIPSGGPIDPWVHRDVPNVEPAAGQLGIKEENDGKASEQQSNREGQRDAD